MTDAIASWLTNTRVGPGRHGDFVVNRGDLILQQILEYGGHTRPELALVSSVVREGDTILDIGAHVGTFAIPLARKVGPTGLVCAFEPVLPSYQLLILNIEMNGLSGVIWPIERAVSDRIGSFSVETPNQRNTGASHLVQAEAGIQSVVLDEWVELNLPDRSIDIIKIDAEGMEPLVLNGAKTVLDRHQPCVYLEVNRDNYSRYGVAIADVASLVAGFRLFVNRGERNAATDHFDLFEIGDIEDVVADHFDLLAIPSKRVDRVVM